VLQNLNLYEQAEILDYPQVRKAVQCGSAAYTLCDRRRIWQQMEWPL
jgi:hypothetical protein